MLELVPRILHTSDGTRYSAAEPQLKPNSAPDQPTYKVFANYITSQERFTSRLKQPPRPVKQINF